MYGNACDNACVGKAIGLRLCHTNLMPPIA